MIAYHPKAREIGENVLASGGNAFDAFVATVVAENVLAEGASSLAGPLGVLVYRVGDKKLSYLDADFNDPLESAGRWTADDPKPGKTALVPGAPAGLEALANEYGSIPFAKLLEPAISLAEDGFPVNNLMAGFIAWRANILKTTDYGRNTFLPRGKALQAGNTIRLPEMAAFLRKFAVEGSAYVYSGDWGKRFITVVQAKGGRLTTKDLAAYRVKWCAPWTITYRGYEVHASSGRSYAGPWTLLALKAFEHARVAGQHYSMNAEALEQMIRIARQVWSEPFLLDYRRLDDPQLVQSRLTSGYAETIFEKVRSKAPAHPIEGLASHSYPIVVRDAQGNIASGTTTIQAEPWGAGIFVQGIPLPSSGSIPWYTKPGERRLSPFCILLALQNGHPRFSVNTISNSVGEAAFQLLVNLIDYKMSVRDAVSSPRFGTFPYGDDPVKQPLRLDRNWLDPRVDEKIVDVLEANGIKTEQKGIIDTGMGAILSMKEKQLSEGNTVPVPYVSDPFGYPPNE